MRLRIYENQQFPPEIKQRCLWGLVYAPIELRDQDQYKDATRIFIAGGTLPQDLYDFVATLPIVMNPDTATLHFDDSQVKYFKKLHSFLPKDSNFVRDLMKQMDERRKLSYKQFKNLYTILTTGKSDYNAGNLSTKN